MCDIRNFFMVQRIIAKYKKEFYEKLGFTVIKEEDIDIGNGYLMNDYVMEKKIG